MKRIVLLLVVGLAGAVCAEPAADGEPREVFDQPPGLCPQQRPRDDAQGPHLGELDLGRGRRLARGGIENMKVRESPYKSNLFNEAGLPLGPLHLDVK